MAGILPGDTEPPESVVPAGGVPADNLGDRRGDGLSLHVHRLGGRGQAVRRAPPPLHRRETSGDPGKQLKKCSENISSAFSSIQKEQQMN